MGIGPLWQHSDLFPQTAINGRRFAYKILWTIVRFRSKLRVCVSVMVVVNVEFSDVTSLVIFRNAVSMFCSSLS